jgi:hypothetical protein
MAIEEREGIIKGLKPLFAVVFAGGCTYRLVLKCGEA